MSSTSLHIDNKSSKFYRSWFTRQRSSSVATVVPAGHDDYSSWKRRAPGNNNKSSPAPPAPIPINKNLKDYIKFKSALIYCLLNIFDLKSGKILNNYSLRQIRIRNSRNLHIIFLHRNDMIDIKISFIDMCYTNIAPVLRTLVFSLLHK